MLPFAPLALLALLVLGPPLLGVGAVRAQYRQRWSVATRLRRLAFALRPTRAQRFAVDLSRAIEHAAAGDAAQAHKALAHWPEDSLQARIARLQLLRFAGDWETLHALPPPDDAAFGWPLLKLRAAAECGQPEAFEALWSQPSLRTPALRDTAWLYLFAFAGRVELVETVLASRLPAMSAEMHGFWIATARLASGDRAALSMLEPLRQSSDATLRAAVTRRLACGPFAPMAPEGLVEVEARALAQTLRYGRNRARPAPRMTLALAVSLMAAFAFQAGAGGDDLEGVLTLGALFGPDVIVEGEWWRTLAYAWLHFGGLHLAVNVAGLVGVGAWIEHALGGARLLAVYFVSAVGAGVIAVLAWRLGLVEAQIIVGASGAVMGLIGALGSVFLRGVRREQAPAARRGLVLVVAVVALQTVFDLAVPQVSLLTHLAGLVVGAMAATLAGVRKEAKFVAPLAAQAR